MHRPSHLLHRVVLAVIGLLCVAVVVLWVRSHSPGRGDCIISARAGGTFVWVYSIEGRLGVFSAPHCPFDVPTQWGRGLYEFPESTPEIRVTGRNGVTWVAPVLDDTGGARSDESDLRSMPMPLSGRRDDWHLPHAGILVVLSLCAAVGPSGRWVRRLRAKRRSEEGRCAACGYDRRAMPGACPECGAGHSDAAGASS